jgi:hypothetical protein
VAANDSPLAKCEQADLGTCADREEEQTDERGNVEHC